MPRGERTSARLLRPRGKGLTLQLSRAVRRRLELRVRPCIRSEVNVDDNELILALHDLLERVEKERGINAAAAHDLLAEMAELAAEEREQKESIP